MGQKINPISLRIASSTKIYDNLWYNDYFYTKLLSFDIYLNRYMNNFLKLLKLPSNRLSICHLPNTTKLYNFFCYPRQSRELKARMYQVSTGLPSSRSRKGAWALDKGIKIDNNYKRNNFQQFINDLTLWKQLNTLKKNGKFYSKKQYQQYLLDIPSKMNLNRNLHSNLNKSYVLSTRKNSLIHQGASALDKGLLDLFLNSNKLTSQLWKNLLMLKLLKNENKVVFDYYDEIQIKVFFKNFFNLLKKENSGFDFSHSKFIKNKNQVFLFLSLLTFFNKQKKFNSLNENILSNLTMNNLLNQVQINENKLKYKNYLENHLSQFYNLNVQLFPFKVHNEWQSANYFADEIIYYLERRISFRRLKTRMLKQISQNSKIRGIRITCSGRVGGKSKKAQRAKIESIKYGQTSLHVFSSKIDFAAKTAYTALGSTGIKVWICYN